ncbi:hypothetical protein Ahy_A05g024996 [Arachis hypogaea]|uniref:SWIM-type domain-containing protein n=1 Tax=Arachis hypogaea TaxID=3818 RepID=A0A445D7Z4_ARAHY|nr:hypothetical protein Ahy_A05g024996 [Arachis hypogaea]
MWKWIRMEWRPKLLVSEDDFCGDGDLFDLDITLGEFHGEIREKKKKRNVKPKTKKASGVQSSELSDDEGLNSDDLENLPSVVDKVRVRATCEAGCGWFAYARQDTETGILRHKIVFGRRDMDRDNVSKDTKLVEKFVVDLVKHECSCRKFQLTRLPCAHVINVINHAKDEIAKYVDACYKRETYVACYTYSVSPCNGEQLWERTEYPDVFSPTYRKPIGRPTKTRSRVEDEEPTGPNMSRA